MHYSHKHSCTLGDLTLIHYVLELHCVIVLVLYTIHTISGIHGFRLMQPSHPQGPAKEQNT